MKRRTINFICVLFLLSVGFTSCERHYYEGRDHRNERRHHRDHDDRDHHDYDHGDNR
ncbi:MAG: hypothetical protein M3139_06255 [Bacteroidota bacterium]|nr:hypothetical protein [Bacteroidota bacterium]